MPCRLMVRGSASGLLPAHALGVLMSISAVAVVLQPMPFYMHTQNPSRFVQRLVWPMRAVATVMQVRVHYNTVADFDAVLVVLRDGFHNASQLVPDDAGIRNQTIGAAEAPISLPQIPAATTLIKTPPGFGTGFSMSTQETFQGSANLIAFMMK